MAFNNGRLQGRIDAIRLVLGHRAFRLFSIGNFCSLTAIWIIRVCVAWLTWEMTHSKTWLGIIAFAELGPSILVSIYSGPMADRRDKFAILRMGQWLQVALALILCLLTLCGWNSIGLMVVLMVGFSIIGGLTLPARLSIAPTLVDRPNLATASALGSITLNVTRLIGPLIAAPLIVSSYEGWAFLIAAVGFAGNAICLTAVGRERDGRSSETSSAASTGYRALLPFLRADRRLWQLLVLQFVLWFALRPLTDMLPAFADVAFHAGERGYSALVASGGIGAILGAIVTMGQSDVEGIRGFVLGGAIAASLAMIAFSLMSTLWLGLLLLGIYGATVTATGIAATTFIQMQTPRDKLGRIMSIYSLIFRFGPAAGALTLGFFADRLGLIPSTIGMAGLALLAVAVYYAVMKRVENRAGQ